MTRYEVQQGDTLTSIAFRFGFFPDSLWTLPENEALRTLRQHGDILMPGDVLVIPEAQPAGLAKSTSQRHRFKRRGVPARLRLQFLRDDGPIASAPYTLIVDGRETTGLTDSEGVLDTFVAPDARSGEIRLDNEVYALQLGTLDPVSELSGVKKRLNNLGWFCGDPDAPADALLERALRQFQERMQLPVTGEADDATREQLRRLHDVPGTLPPLVQENA